MRLIILALLCTSVDSYKILIHQSKFSYSMSNFLLNIADTLVDAGHNVTTLLSVISDEYPTDTKSAVLRVEQSEATRRQQSAYADVMRDFSNKHPYDPVAAYKLGEYFGKLCALQCEAILDEPGLIERLRNEKYDVMIVEHYDKCGIPLTELIKPKAVVSSQSSVLFGQHYDEFGVPQMMSYGPCYLLTEFNVHSFFDHLKNIAACFVERIAWHEYVTETEALFRRRFGDNFPSIAEISSHSAYVFVNAEPLIDFATPTMAKIINVGGIAVEQPKPLSKDWNNILSRRNNTVLISFGTFLKSIFFNDEMKMAIVKLASALSEVTFIWKYEQDDDFSKSVMATVPNLVLAKWIPQSDLLNDDRLSLFVTHAGMGSTQETARRGVPAVFVPQFTEQFRNAGMMQYNKLGKVISNSEILETSKFVSIVQEVLNNESYRQNAKHVSRMLAKKPFSAREQLIKYTEFAAEFGPSPALRPQSHDMNWIEYHNLDIIEMKLMKSLSTCLLLLTQVLICDTYKILVYNPKFGYSNSRFQGRIADILVEAGHNVTSLISEQDPEYFDGTTKSTIIRVGQGEATRMVQATYDDKKANLLFAQKLLDPISAFMMSKFFGTLFASQCVQLLDEPGLIQRLTNESYDVMIAENFDMCGIALSHLIKPKSLISTVSTFAFAQHFEEFGLPQIMSFTPGAVTTWLDVHSFWSRARNILAIYQEKIMCYHFSADINKLFQKRYGSDFPTVEQISSHSAYVLINAEPLIDFATPTLSKVVFIGGIGTTEPKELSKEWVEILNRREKTVLLSFGSVMKGIFLPHEVKQSMLKMIQTFPNVTFIWKYEQDDEFTRAESKKNANIVFKKWTPQGDLLNHTRLAAFITHGGMGSTQEIAARGVPGIFVPLFGDQPRNAGMMEYNKLGKAIDKFDIVNPVKLIAVVREVLENECYRKNAKRSAAMIGNKPFSSKELLIRHVEFAAEFGPSPALRPQSHDMNWIEYHNIDIIFVFTLLSILVVYVTIKLIFNWLRQVTVMKLKNE